MTSPADDLKTAVIIEDDPEIRLILADVLESAGFSTVSVGNGIDGVRAVGAYEPLLTTVDVTMPGIDGFEAVRRIRASQSDTYIIMLTGLNDEADVIAGLGAGADDYLLKPFRPRELRARVEALLRRTRGEGGSLATGGMATAPAGAPAPAAASDPQPGAATSVSEDPGATTAPAADSGWIAHRDLLLHPENRLVTIGGRDLDLTRTEFDLLATLLESKRRVRSKADLTLVLRGESYVTSYFVGDADKRAVEAHMTNLRRKLGDSPTNPRYIETVRGVGYRLTSEHA
ncbi:response regulator transcription factor [Microbacterium sp. NPDC057407]|uniref:response regulator transcription factor n=1 Tax=Microbacterium sp. NPDC057407 TaxID=3346120 RepID=UPI00366B3E43